MLVITRRSGQALLIGDVTVTLVSVTGKSALFSFASDSGGERAPKAPQADVAEGRSARLVRCRTGESVEVVSVATLTLVDISHGGEKVRIGIEAPVHTRVYRQEVCEQFATSVPPPAPAPPVKVTFQDDGFTPGDLALVLKYLSAVYREEGGNGLKVVKGRQLVPANEGVAS